VPNQHSLNLLSLDEILI